MDAVELAKIEADLLFDRRALPGAVDRWKALRPGVRRRQLTRFARAEQHRDLVEARLAEDPALAAAWQEFPLTEQRECLAAYAMVWPRSRSIRLFIDTVAQGSAYRRIAADAEQADP